MIRLIPKMSVSKMSMSTVPKRAIKCAGCLIIGDEVLNGKILDTNSHFFSKFCFGELSIPVKNTIVCGDDKSDIKKSLDVLIGNGCDFIVTSGGIGPTHDDITYEALADAFGISCKLDAETVAKMHGLRGEYLAGLEPRRLDAFYRMAMFPFDDTDTVEVERIYTEDSLWVPIVGLDRKVYILPGIPQLFQKLLVNLGGSIKSRIDPSLLLKRWYVKTVVKESELAPFLSDLQSECNEKFGVGSVKLGSYPHYAWRVNTVSVIGNEKVEDDVLGEIVQRVVESVDGEVISVEEEERMSGERDNIDSN